MHYPKRLAAMISLHLRNGRVDEARRIFDIVPRPDLYLYTVMINGYSHLAKIDEALKLFYKMPVRDTISWNTVIKGCLNCGYLDLACKLFHAIPERSVVSWTTMIDGLAQSGRVEAAEMLFRKMPVRDTAAWNSMMYGYVVNGRVEDAYKLFKDMPQPNVISWTTVIGALDRVGDHGDEALSLFHEMRISRLQPTSDTYASLLSLCANARSLTKGVQFHAHLLKSGDIADPYIATSLVTLYSNCVQTDSAHKFFDDVVRKDVVLCTALITGYSLNSKHRQAVGVFCDLLFNGIEPNIFTFTSTLNSCVGLEILDVGKGIHALAIKLGLDQDPYTGNSLISLYTKLGSIYDGVAIFDNMDKKNLVSWNSIIVGCAQHGLGSQTLDFYKQMTNFGVQPDEITYFGLLTACRHSRMFDQGMAFFQMLVNDSLVEVKLEHYICMVDMLGRSGKLVEAEDFIKNMPFQATNSFAWLTLLDACKDHYHLEAARRIALGIIEQDPYNAAAYVLLSNSYAACGRWDDVSHVRLIMKSRGVAKIPGCSWITRSE